MTTDGQGHHQDLAWAAFCYVADEMTDAERHEFEARLEHDEAACQAVADAVAWTSAVTGALRSEGPRVTLPTRPARRSLRRTGVGAGLAASLLVAVFCVWNRQPPSDPVTPTPDVVAVEEDLHEAAPEDLATVWWNTWSEALESEQREDGLLPPLTEQEVASWRLEAPTASPTPEWMRSAVADTSADDADDEDEADSDDGTQEG